MTPSPSKVPEKDKGREPSTKEPEKTQEKKPSSPEDHSAKPKLIPNKPITPIGSNKSNENPEAPIDPESAAQPII